MNAEFWRNKRVLLTGHTGFKGAWLSLWLQKLGAIVVGYALPPPSSTPNLFELAAVGSDMESVYGDIRHKEQLQEVFARFRPEIVLHLAAQALVRQSYVDPIETYQVNVMGTIHVLEAVRNSPSCRAVVNVTSDKCYENNEWTWGYRENDQMGGHDPYSSSKGCAELVTAAYRRSFFELRDAPRVGIASARAGNVIGGGDFSKDRLIPDIMAAMLSGTQLQIRYPDSIRPWQHVLEPLAGYLLLAEKLWADPQRFAQSWNFGPAMDDVQPVHWIVEKVNRHCQHRLHWQINNASAPHEARLLMLDSTKARLTLGWKPRWPLERALQAVVEWYGAYEKNERLREVTLQQIATYESTDALDADPDAADLVGDSHAAKLTQRASNTAAATR